MWVNEKWQQLAFYFWIKTDVKIKAPIKLWYAKFGCQCQNEYFINVKQLPFDLSSVRDFS